MLDIIILAVIAALIFAKLFKTLGKVEEGDEIEAPNFLRKRADMETPAMADIEIASAFEAGLPQRIRDVFDKARKIAPDFNPERFLNGAKSAFELIVKAFSKGDTTSLKSLLSREVFDSFSSEIQRRAGAREAHETTIVKFSECDIVDATLNNNILTISVKFVTEQINLIKDSAGNIIMGDPSNTETIRDIWVFAKHLKTASPIWELVETKTPK